MPRQNIGGLGGISNPGFGDKLQVICESLGAVLIDTPPEHWLVPLPEGRAYAIYVEGRNVERPDWSRVEAGILARACLSWRDILQTHLSVAKTMGVARPVSVPRWHGVAVCPRCNELQIKQSSASNGDFCWSCPANCRETHRSSARSCAECKSEVQVLWTTEQEVPAEWM